MSSSNNTLQPTYKYNFLGEGRVTEDGHRVYFEKLELIGGEETVIVSVGDNCYFHSGESTLVPSSTTSPIKQQKQKNSSDEDESNTETKEKDSIDDESDKDKERDDFWVNAMDPFIGKVEQFWMEPAETSTEDSNEVLRMRVKARWYIKKEEMSGLLPMMGEGCQFILSSSSHNNNNKPITNPQALIGTLTDHDLVLGDEGDENLIQTILGKCEVIRRPPKKFDGLEQQEDDNSEEEEIPKGVYVSRFDLLVPGKGEPHFGNVVLKPYRSSLHSTTSSKKRSAENSIVNNEESLEEYEEGSSSNSNKRAKTTESDDDGMSQEDDSQTQDDVEEDEEESQASQTGNVTAGENKSIDMDEESQEAGETETEGDLASQQDGVDDVDNANNDANEEGSTSTNAEDDISINLGQNHEGKIRVGREFQAVVPALSTLPLTRKEIQEYDIENNFQMIWVPGRISKDDLASYLNMSSQILKYFASRDPDYVLSQIGIKDYEKIWRFYDGIFREADEDKILKQLHDSDYKTEIALGAIRSSPIDFMTLWKKEEREAFDNDWKRYCGSIRKINVDSKSRKDVVDYHYRFKIPDQFCKFRQQRKEQARRMVAIIDAKNATAQPGQLKPQAKALSAERNRAVAKNFLIDIKDKYGNDIYSQVTTLLKQFHEKFLTVPMFKDEMFQIIGNDTDLITRFSAFLPKQYQD